MLICAHKGLYLGYVKVYEEYYDCSLHTCSRSCSRVRDQSMEV